MSTTNILFNKGIDEIAKCRNIGLSPKWTPDIELNEAEMSSEYYYKPYRIAEKNKNVKSKLLGYWSYVKKNEDEVSLLYTRPLISHDNVLIGVIGVEVNQKTLLAKMGNLGANENSKRINYLCKGGGNDKEYSIVTTTEFDDITEGDKIILEDYNGEDIMTVNNAKGDYVATHIPLNLYEKNTPFADEHWHVISIIERSDLLEFHTSLRRLFYIWLFLVIGAAIVGINVIGKIIIKPINTVIDDLKNSNPGREKVKFKKLNIKEIDNLTDSIEGLSTEIIESSERISRLFKISQLTIGTFDYSEESNLVYCSGNFKKLLNWYMDLDTDYITMDAEEFAGRLKGIIRHAELVNENEYLVQARISGREEWLSIIILFEKSRVVGIIANVTKDVMEKNRIEYERDFDTLTNVYNLGAFNREVYLLLNREDLGVAALVMWDLDNLKFINDTYGHNFGDQYLQAFASTVTFLENDTYCFARRSGDEFYLFIYGHDTKEEIEEKVYELYEHVKNRKLSLPDGKDFNIRVSAGVAWYPYDSDRLEELFRFADFTMYEAKNNSKGCMTTFNKELYLEKVHIMDGYEPISRFFEKKLVKYAYQPIISVEKNKIYGYELLMRSDFKDAEYSPEDLLNMARAHAKLYPIEVTTWFEGLASFKKYREEGKLKEDDLIFINSIGSKILTRDDIEELEKMYPEYLKNIVLELTESDEAEDNLNITKAEAIRKWGGKLAIDDFGSGYNSTAIMLFVKPDIVKIDRSIITNIDKDINRQNIYRSFVNYTKGTNIKVLAEGVETEDELETVIELGADLIQGFYFSKPSFEINPIEQSKLDKLKEFKEKQKR